MRLCGDAAPPPTRSVLSRYPAVSTHMGEVHGIDLSAGVVHAEDVVIGWDWLVLAPGGVTSYFGHDEWREHALGLKTLADALRIRSHILTSYERAENETDPEERRRLMTIVVVGGGPTGVELAGALAEIGRHTLARDFRTIDPTEVRVVLVEGRDRVLAEREGDVRLEALREGFSAVPLTRPARLLRADQVRRQVARVIDGFLHRLFRNFVEHDPVHGLGVEDVALLE